MNRLPNFSTLSVAAIAGMALLASCSADSPFDGASGGEGKIQLHLASSGDVTSAIPTITRAEAPDVPDPGEFSITLSRIDGSWSRTYKNLQEFANEEGFSTGAYKISASYGSLDQEGFEKPYYYGESQVTVLEDRVSDVEILATIQNALVSINYTEAFKEYFASWTSTIHTEGHEYVTYTSDETRPAYIAPGTTTVGIDLTDKNGKSVKLQPCNFNSVGRNHYRITFDVNGGQVGVAQLQIIFDDTLTREDVTIDLTDELFTTPAPTLTADGFTAGEPLVGVASEPFGSNTAISVMARGGIASAVLTFESTNYSLSATNEFELVNASEQTQNLLGSYGIDCKGFYKNPDQMAVINLTNLPNRLPAGVHKVTLLVKDAVDRASDPLTLVCDLDELKFNPTPETIPFGASTAKFNIAYNGSNPAENLSFHVLDNNGAYQEAEVISITESNSRAVDSRNYTVNLRIPESERANIPVKVLHCGKEFTSFNIPVDIPEYNIEVDPHATFAMVKVSTEDPSFLTPVTKALTLTLSGSNASQARLVRDTENGFITVTGLSPASQYTCKHSIATDATPSSAAFTTETATPLTNGSFSDTQTTFSKTLQCGGKFKVALTSYTIKVPIKIDEPTGWATINQKTAYANAANQNSWFVVPSTNTSNGEVTVRSVAYDHNGTTPEASSEGTSMQYYCHNAPTSFANRDAGELFLGSYSFDGSEHRTDGIPFASRPTTLSFDYTFTPYTNDKGVAETGWAEIEVLDAAGDVISSTSFNIAAQATKTTKTITLPAYPFGKKAASLKVNFKSSTASQPGTHVPTGTELKEGGSGWNRTLPTNDYHALSTGSTLVLDNVTLGYNLDSAARNNKSRNQAKKRK